MSIPSKTKDPHAVEEYWIDWGTWLAEVSDTISTQTFLITSNPDEALVKDSEQLNGTKHVIWLSGGTAGKTYRITSRITTAGGRTNDQSMDIVVAEK